MKLVGPKVEMQMRPQQRQTLLILVQSSGPVLREEAALPPSWICLHLDREVCVAHTGQGLSHCLQIQLSS